MDDVIAFSKDPMKIMQDLERTYVMKGVGTPQYYLGGDVVELGNPWDKEGIYTAFSAETYITNCLKKLATMCGIPEFAKHKSPMDSEYHPELERLRNRAIDPVPASAPPEPIPKRPHVGDAAEPARIADKRRCAVLKRV